MSYIARPLFSNFTLIIGLIRGKTPTKIRHLMAFSSNYPPLMIFVIYSKASFLKFGTHYRADLRKETYEDPMFLLSNQQLIMIFVIYSKASLIKSGTHCSADLRKDTYEGKASYVSFLKSATNPTSDLRKETYKHKVSFGSGLPIIL